jgi:cytoskeletal protein CcmA (bactofilin family)
MFGRKNGEEAVQETLTNTNNTQETLLAPRMTEPSATAQRALSPATSTRRVVDIPSSRRSSSAASSGEERKLTVGKGLSLAGEIASCDILVVEGKVEARLTDGKLLEITESGQFRGSVEIENADIAGRYDGELVVHGRLTVRSTGRISGVVRYGELEINAGGQVIGEMQVVNAAQQAETGGFKSAARHTAGDELESAARKTA